MVLPLTAMAVIVCPAPTSWTLVQSQREAALHTVFQAAVSVQTYCPPVTQWFGLLTSVVMGVLKRGFGSQPAIGPAGSTVKQDGETVLKLCPPLVVMYGFM